MCVCAKYRGKPWGGKRRVSCLHPSRDILVRSNLRGRGKEVVCCNYLLLLLLLIYASFVGFCCGLRGLPERRVGAPCGSSVALLCEDRERQAVKPSCVNQAECQVTPWCHSGDLRLLHECKKEKKARSVAASVARKAAFQRSEPEFGVEDGDLRNFQNPKVYAGCFKLAGRVLTIL